MYIEVLVEDSSGRNALQELIPRIVDGRVGFRIHAYKGLGRLPKGLQSTSDPGKRILLDNLPRLLRGYSATHAASGFPNCVLVVCDLDDKDKSRFLQELEQVANEYHSLLPTYFFFAIEEGEAWYLGDTKAIKSAYPNAKKNILEGYQQDSICGTWELLADAISKGGSKGLKKGGWHVIGAEKHKWAMEIPPHMDIEVNLSPSFVEFRDGLRKLAQLGVQSTA
jgi:hypothetical protein